jgi:tRNA (guanine-N7-)-methyltransferase
MLTAGSLEVIQAFHPDPWPKRRHAIRRLLQAPLVARLAELLTPGGVLHVVIDDDTYAASVRDAAAAAGTLASITPPPAPETKYGRRARAAGRTVHDMAWTRT